jgi:hypothetical protein
MKRKMLSNVTRVLMGAAMAGGSLFAVQPEYRNATEAFQLLKEVQTRAAGLKSDAWRLESFTRGQLSWETHADQLTQTKEQVNYIGERLLQLMAVRDAEAPWQQQAIDSVVPVAATIAASTEAAIEYLNDNQKVLWKTEYVDHLKTIADHADQLKESVDLYLEVAGTQDKLEQLRTKAAMPGS